MPLALFTDSTPLTPIRNLFNTIIQQLNKQEVVNYADLDALPSTAGLAEATRAHVDELNVDFQVQDGTWVQVGTSRFASTGARDTAYAKGAGAYLVANTRALVTATTPGVTYVYTGSTWLAGPVTATLTPGTSCTINAPTSVKKEANGLVVANVDISRTSGSFTTGDAIATFPADCRPAGAVSIGAGLVNATPVFATLSTAGVLNIYFTGTTTNQFRGTFVFYAAA